MPKSTIETSIQAQCRHAMQKLAESGSVFTEIDVINKASQGRGWNNKIYREAADRAYIVLQTAYRQGNLVRFGPVDYKGHKDYARKGTKIVYAKRDIDLKSWETPNGTFPRLLAEDDLMSSPGRKPNQIVDRDDSQPWDFQKVHVRERQSNGRSHSGPPVDTRPLEQKIQQLEAQLKRYETNGHGQDLDPDDFADKVVDRLSEKLAEALIG